MVYKQLFFLVGVVKDIDLQGVPGPGMFQNLEKCSRPLMYSRVHKIDILEPVWQLQYISLCDKICLDNMFDIILFKQDISTQLQYQIQIQIQGYRYIHSWLIIFRNLSDLFSSSGGFYLSCSPGCIFVTYLDLIFTNL